MQPVLDLRYLKLPEPEVVRSTHELTAYEMQEVETWINPRHRPGWLASRWLIKRMYRERLSGHHERQFDPMRLSILSRDDVGRPARPTIIYDDRAVDLDVSISHTHRGVLVGFSRRRDLTLGVDLAEPKQARVGTFDPWYTQPERLWIQRQNDDSAAAQLWTIKQAYFKAVNRGEAFSPRRIEVTLDASGHFQCSYSRLSHAVSAYIAVTTCDDHVASLVVILPENMPNEVPKTYDSVIPQSDLIRIGLKQ